MMHDMNGKACTSRQSDRSGFEQWPSRIAVSGAELLKNIEYLNLWVDGLVQYHENSFQRVHDCLRSGAGITNAAEGYKCVDSAESIICQTHKRVVNGILIR